MSWPANALTSSFCDKTNVRGVSSGVCSSTTTFSDRAPVVCANRLYRSKGRGSACQVPLSSSKPPPASKFSWGAEMPPKRDSGNFADKAAIDLVPSTLPRYDDGFASTAPVGKFVPNAIGIHDGSGNVAEWVNDFYTVPTPGLTKAVVDPMGPETGNAHVIRGSSWRHAGILELRLSYRDSGTGPRPDVGFRIARAVE